MRDDPFYLADDRSSRPKVDDVDNIPVVRLDDLPPLPQSTGEQDLMFFGRDFYTLHRQLTPTKSEKHSAFHNAPGTPDVGGG